MIAISTGGIALAVVLLACVLVPWWRKGGGGKGRPGAEHEGGGRTWRPLVGPILTFALGIVCATSVGGVVGAVARMGTRGSGQLGNDGLSVLFGAQPETRSHPALPHLGGGPAIIVLAALVTLYLVAKKATKQRKRDLIFSLLAGLALAPAAFALQLAHGALLPFLTSGGQQITGHM